MPDLNTPEDVLLAAMCVMGFAVVVICVAMLVWPIAQLIESNDGAAEREVKS